MDADPEVLSGGREPGAPRAAAARRRDRAHSVWIPVRRGLVVGLAVAVLAGAGAVLWRRAHPAPLPVPTVLVEVDPSEYLLPQSQGGDSEPGLLLLLHVSLRPGPGERPTGALSIVAVEGGGVSAHGHYDVPGGAAGAGGQVTLSTSLSCQDWAAGAGVRVRLEVAADGRTAATTATLDLGPGSPVHAQLDEVCARYVEAHPLRVMAVTDSLDPTEPLVHLDWTIHNPTDRVLVVGEGMGLSGLRTPGPDVLPSAAEQPLALVPGATGHVRSTLQVTTCQGASFDPAGAEVTLSVREPGAGDDVTGMSVPLPATARAASFTSAARACRGAPLLLSPAVTLAASPEHGAAPGGGITVTASVSAQVAADGHWTAAFTRPQWYAGDEPARPFRDGDATVDAPGDLRLVGHWTAAGCPALTAAFSGQLQVPVVLRGARDYPYALDVTTRIDSTSCQTAPGP